jgi:hypothetical protein
MAGPFSRVTLTVTTDASGNATVLVPQADADVGSVTYEKDPPLKPLNGAVFAITYTKIDYAAGVDFTITTEATSQGIWTELDVNATKTVHPYVAANDLAGVPFLFAAAGEPVPGDPPVVADDRVKIVVANGGNAKSGTFTIVLG